MFSFFSIGFSNSRSIGLAFGHRSRLIVLDLGLLTRKVVVLWACEIKKGLEIEDKKENRG